MPFAIRIHQTGGPEVMCWEEVAVGNPAPGEARVRHEAVGLNYIDVYHRNGLYPLPMPSGIGLEAAGVVEAIGEGVTEVVVWGIAWLTPAGRSALTVRRVACRRTGC